MKANTGTSTFNHTHSINEQMKSKLIWGCHQSLMKLAVGETDMGNEVNNQMVKKQSDHPSKRSKSTCDISERTDKWAIRDWRNSKCQED
jgi:hypothetical protein